jgi:hypothetical protein
MNEKVTLNRICLFISLPPESPTRGYLTGAGGGREPDRHADIFWEPRKTNERVGPSARLERPKGQLTKNAGNGRELSANPSKLKDCRGATS